MHEIPACILWSALLQHQMTMQCAATVATDLPLYDAVANRGTATASCTQQPQCWQ